MERPARPDLIFNIFYFIKIYETIQKVPTQVLTTYDSEVFTITENKNKFYKNLQLFGRINVWLDLQNKRKVRHNQILNLPVSCMNELMPSDQLKFYYLFVIFVYFPWADHFEFSWHLNVSICNKLLNLPT